MEANLLDNLLPAGKRDEAQRILRSCVHCGFCTATCPTYLELGDDLDSPRGRIYQIKNMLEGLAPTRATQVHLDRCLSCNNCVTACPSGVEYNHLIDIGRDFVETKVKRPFGERLLRWALRTFVPDEKRFAFMVRMGQTFRPLVPAALRSQIPKELPKKAAPVKQTAAGEQGFSRKMILPRGCVQPTLMPATAESTVRVLNAIGVEVLQPEGCCGAVSQHLAAPDDAKAWMRRNIDLWIPMIEDGAEAIIITDSGCGVQVKNYGHHFKDEPAYADKAKRISELCRDLCEVITVEDIEKIQTPQQPSAPAAPVDSESATVEDAAASETAASESAVETPAAASAPAAPQPATAADYAAPAAPEAAVESVEAEPKKRRRIAFHAPCTLQHGQKLNGKTEALLIAAGFDLLPVSEAHSCCGSAGTYSVLQPELATNLRNKKIANLTQSRPELVATANVGCQVHLQQAKNAPPIVHWITLLDPAA